MFDEKGREALELVTSLIGSLSRMKILHSDSKLMIQSSSELDFLLSTLNNKNSSKKIEELEQKLDAIMKLLNIKEEKASETPHILVKGKKTVEVTEKFRVNFPRTHFID